MQNSNSKLNTVLLIIVIILIAIGIWMLSVNEKVVDRIESDTETSVVGDVVVKEETKQVTQPTTTTTYQYPATGPAFFTIKAKGNPVVSTSASANGITFSGSSGSDFVRYSTGFTLSSPNPCLADISGNMLLGTKEEKFGTRTYTSCFNDGTTFYIGSGFEGNAVVIAASGENRTLPHYVDLSTLAFPMEGEN